jgi:hypothetical protein
MTLKRARTDLVSRGTWRGRGMPISNWAGPNQFRTINKSTTKHTHPRDREQPKSSSSSPSICEGRYLEWSDLLRTGSRWARSCSSKDTHNTSNISPRHCPRPCRPHSTTASTTTRPSETRPYSPPSCHSLTCSATLRPSLPSMWEGRQTSSALSPISNPSHKQPMDEEVALPSNSSPAHLIKITAPLLCYVIRNAASSQPAYSANSSVPLSRPSFSPRRRAKSSSPGTSGSDKGRSIHSTCKVWGITRRR